MKKRISKTLYAAIAFFVGFILWTVMVRFVDVKPIGPLDSEVGFATLNGCVHALTGVNMSLYTLTDWLGLVPLGFVLGFALLGLIQWIKRGKLCRVDRSILVLGGFYVLVFVAFLFFEVLVINYRPVLIEGILEASYPSSTTMLVMCVIPTTVSQLNARIHRSALGKITSLVLIAFLLLMVVLRLLSGVHWVTDIIGGALLSAGFVHTYRFFADQFKSI